MSVFLSRSDKFFRWNHLLKEQSFFSIFSLQEFCDIFGKCEKHDLQSDTRENKNLNFGLVNLINEKMGDGIDSSDIIIDIIAAICMTMLLKWIKKCYNRHQEKMIRQIQPVQMQMQPSQPLQPLQQLQVPALAPPVAQPAYRIHYRPASISEPETAMEDSMKKYRTQIRNCYRNTYATGPRAKVCTLMT